MNHSLRHPQPTSGHLNHEIQPPRAPVLRGLKTSHLIICPWVMKQQNSQETGHSWVQVVYTLCWFQSVTKRNKSSSKITADGDCTHEIKRRLLLGRKVMTNLDSILKSRDMTLSTKLRLVKAMVFPVVMCRCELDHKESWAPKNWCFWTVVLEKTLESRLDCKEMQPVHPKGDQSWAFTGTTDAEAEAPILWPPDVKSWLIWKGPDAGKDWRQDEKGMTEDEMAGWYHRLDGHEFE